jgi:hypothetical protein
MAALNLFLCRIANSEIMLIDRLEHGNFVESYCTQDKPFMVHRRTNKKDSVAWDFYFSQLRDPKKFAEPHQNVPYGRIHQYFLLF